jgi:hypothetical protein
MAARKAQKMSLTSIVGTGRCESTMLSRMFNMHPQILSLSEFWNLFPDRDINILSSSAMSMAR